MRAMAAAAAGRSMVMRRDFAGANRTLLFFSEDLCLAGDNYDYISEMTHEAPPFTGYPEFDAGLAAFAEIHRQLVGLRLLEWFREPGRYIELSALYPHEVVDETPGAYDGLVHPTLLEHGVIIRGASLAAYRGR
jgi:hypothetical protein